MAEEPKMKPVRLRAADHERVNNLRHKLIKTRGADVSLSQTIMEAIKLLEDKTK